LWPPRGGNVKAETSSQSPQFRDPRRQPLEPLVRRWHQPQAKGENSMIAKTVIAKILVAKILLAGMALILSLGAGPAFAAVCLDKSMTLEEIVDAINATTGCGKAMKLFEACEFGASGDVDLGAAVEKKCEGDFRAGLKASQKASYQREMRGCDRKYRNKSGTMYLSFTAFCRAEVTQRYSRQALEAAGKSR
jgi:hypothetical protein